MSGESRRKVYKKLLIKELIETIKKIDSDEGKQQFIRTKEYMRAAQKLRSRLYEDGRRSDSTKVGLMTYRRYLSDVRKAVRAENWKHHSLPKTVAKFALKFPDFAKRLEKLLVLNAEDMRKAHTELCQYAQKQYKATGERKYREAYHAFKDMKLDHDVLRHLAMQDMEKADIAEQDQEALTKKKSNVLTFNHDWLMDGINRLIESPYFGDCALGLALASGRRAVEILYQGRFKATGEYKIVFTGQAKKQGGVDSRFKMNIYTLIPAKEFCQAMDEFRKRKPVEALKQYDELPETERNIQINRRTAKTLSEAAKKFFKDEARMFKESRAIWARIVYEKHFKSDKMWKDKDEDLFWKAMLGHDDVETQQHYKYIKIDYTPAPEEEKPVYTNEHGENLRIKKLMRLAKDFRIANRAALARINEFVMARINEKPEEVFTQSMISRELGANRTAIKDYMSIVDGKYKNLLTKPMLAKKDIEPEDMEKAEARKPAKRARKTTAKKTATRKKTTARKTTRKTSKKADQPKE